MTVPAPFTREQVLDVVTFDPVTGVICWRHTYKLQRRGAMLGRLDRDGYLRVRLLGKSVMAHTLVWFLMTGAWCPGDVDHWNRDRLDNSPGNLRLATVHQQRANASIQKNNTTGRKGVVFTKSKSRPYWARIMVKGDRLDLGYFTTPESAAEAYDLAALTHFGEFAATNEMQQAK